MIEITTEPEFDLALKINPDAVVLFTAPAWCVPCRRFEPHWSKAEEVCAGRQYETAFLRVDFGADPLAIAGHWASDRFNILSVPTVYRIMGDTYWEMKSRTLLPFLKELGNE